MTPSTRFSSMSDVAEPPEIQVTGSPSGRAGPPPAAHGHDLIEPDDTDVAVRHERAGPATLGRTTVQHDGSGLGDRDGAAGEHRGDPVEVGGGEIRPVVDGDALRQILKPAWWRARGYQQAVNARL